MIGNRFERLVVASRQGTDKFKNATWLCDCDCGRQHIATTAQLNRGSVTSCGCKKLEGLRKIHGLKRHELYPTWLNMRQRCRNPKHPRYADWGGRGIKVCDRWDDFPNFLKDVGERPQGKTLDRRDNDGDYCPENVRWATPLEQNTNKGRNSLGPMPN